MNAYTHRNLVAKFSHQTGDSVLRQRIMVIGRSVTTVQRISRYCLEQGAEVLPYYGFPTVEEADLFDPEVLVVCLPGAEDFLHQINRPYILWSEQTMDIGLPLVSNRQELIASLRQLAVN